ncbi:hypothetical protein ABZ543_10105 [Streptomyces roseifaciens]
MAATAVAAADHPARGAQGERAPDEIWVSAGTGGFSAVYGGSERYKSQEARGKFQIAL